MADPWFRFNMGSKWSWRELSLRLVANHLSLSLSSFVWWWWVINQGSEMNENTTVLVGNWLRPKKEKKKKGPSSTAKGVYTCRLSLSLGVDHAAAGALQLSGMGFDGSLPIPYANSWWISLSLLIYDGLAQKNVNRKFSYETDIASERSNHDQLREIVQRFFLFFFFRAISARGRRPLSTRCIWLSKQTVAGGHETISFWSETCLP